MPHDLSAIHPLDVSRCTVAPTRTPLSAVALLLVALFAVMWTGCREKQVVESDFTPEPLEESGPPRAFRLGFSALPSELTDEAYLAALNLAANFGDTVLLQRTPSWSDFLPDSNVSDELTDATVRDRAAIEARELELFVALDPFDPNGRGHLASVPEGFEGADLTDPELRQALVAEAQFIASNLRPDYLALAMEINGTFERDPAQYQAFVEAYIEAYDAVKAISPTTSVFVTFQYEELLGVVPWEAPHTARWELLDDFEGRLDLFAITTYPSFTYEVARKVPPLYYQQIRDHTSLSIAFASTGYSSAPGRDGVNSSTPAEQRRYLQRLLAEADQLASPLVIWLAGRDLAFATEPPFDLLASIGLRDTADQPKEAWTVWLRAAARPYNPAALDEPIPDAG